MQIHLKDTIAHLMHKDTAVEVAHLDHMIDWIEWDLDMAYHQVD